MLFLKGFSQEKNTISLQIRDINTQEPVYGAYIFVNNNVIASSDDKGCFRILIDDLNSSKICISHISYETYCLENLSHSVKEILMTPSIKLLEEVAVYKEIPKLEPFIKKISTIYKKTIPYGFTAKYQQKQILYNGDIPVSYVEQIGNGLFFGPKEMDPFNISFQSVCQARNYVTANNKIQLWGMNYRYIQVNHPLGEKSNNYRFTLNNFEKINGKDYAVVTYLSDKTMKSHHTKVSNVRGKMWIDMETHTISKEEVEYNKKIVGVSTTKVIFYYTLTEENLNIPNKIEEINTKDNQKHYHTVLNLYIENNYTKLEYDTFSVCWDNDISYDKNYWKEMKIEKNDVFYNDLKKLMGEKLESNEFNETIYLKFKEQINAQHSYSKKVIQEIIKQYTKKNKR